MACGRDGRQTFPVWSLVVMHISHLLLGKQPICISVQILENCPIFGDAFPHSNNAARFWYGIHSIVTSLTTIRIESGLYWKRKILAVQYFAIF